MLTVVAGPTASGKSALALALAERIGGIVINADAMQCYAEWRIITARPSPADEARVPHRLYGVRRLDEPVDASWWRGAARAELERASANGARPILCGGTGLYLKSLVHGMAPIPDPVAEARETARRMLAEDGPAALHEWLEARDPETAAKLRPSDSQRLARAVEVLLGTGTGLAAWQKLPGDPLPGWSVRLILLDPPRADLRAAIATRFDAMLEAGAVAEVRAVLARNPDPSLPGLRAHGVPELTAYLRGESTLDEAAARAIAATNAYTKRQRTWFRHQTIADACHTRNITARINHDTQLSERFLDELAGFIDGSS